MYKFLKNLLCLLLVLFAFSACRKKALDDFYGAPSTLAPSLYQTMQNRGNFTNFLALVDKAGYTSTLSSAGYWTLFAPNDAAFQKYFTANNITSVSQISATTATQIVTYALVYSGYSSLANGNPSGSTLDYVQPAVSTSLNNTITIQAAFKRKTVYHDDVYQDTVPNFSTYGALAGQKINMIAQNRNGAYDYKDANNKYIPFFTQTYFNQYKLQSTDYTYFFPNSTFTNSESNFNVLDGNVINANIICQNGVLDEINTVPVPLPSIEKYLKTNSNYSHFYQFIQRYGSLVSYVADANKTTNYQAISGSTGTVYAKDYATSATLLPYSLSNENYLVQGGGTTDPQGNGWTFFAPNNTAFDAYVKNVLLEHYTSISLLPQTVIVDFISAHMATETIWPSQFALTTNLNGKGELMNINPYTDVNDKIFCSNGLFYGTSKVQQTNVFTTVFGRPYLDPAYSIMTRMLTFYNYKINLSNPTFKYTMIMVPDAALAKLGYSLNIALEGANPAQSGLSYTNPTTGAVTTGTTVDNTLLRILNLGIFLTPNNEMANLSGTPLGIYATAGLGGMAPEYVKFANNQLVAAGNQDAGTSVTVNPNYYTTSNGIVYYPANTSAPVTLVNTPVTNSVGQDIFNKGQIAPVNGVGGDPYYYFYKFLSNSLLWTAATKAIQGIDVGTDYTLFIPSNAAILDAVNNGWLPSTGTGAVKTPNFAPTAASDINLVSSFIKYHILKPTQVVPDGKKTGAFTTELFNSDGSSVSLTINNTVAGSMTVTDGQGRTANVLPVSNITLADHVVIVPIDTYLQYLDYTSVSAANPYPFRY